MGIKKILLFAFKNNLIKSLYVNARQFGLKGILFMPIVLEYGVTFSCKGKLHCSMPIRFRMLTVRSKSSVIIHKNGRLQLNGYKCTFNANTNILIGEKATMELGNRFHSNGRSDFNCFKRVVFGDNVLLSVNVMLMDTDFHKMFNFQSEIINPNKEIIIGNDVWIGCNTTILKGTKIGNNVIIGACSLLSGSYLESFSIYAGLPAQEKKKNIKWAN